MAVLAINGGTPVRRRPFPAWPLADAHERTWLEKVLTGNRWFAGARGDDPESLGVLFGQRFAKFVADWEPSEVRTFTALLQKLEASKAAVAAYERRPAGRRWAQQRPPELGRSGDPANV